MLKIGDFSQLAQVTVKTLRYYDRLGLLKPAWIDRFTGYRYYSLQQLPRLNRILALKDLGFSLDEISGLLNEDLALDQMETMLRMKRSELQRSIQAEQTRLDRVEARLHQIRQEGRLVPQEVLLRRLDAVTVASLQEAVPLASQLMSHRKKVFREIQAWLKEVRLEPSGAYLTIYHDPEYRDRDIHLEAAVPLEAHALRQSFPPTHSRVYLHSLPAVEEAACLVIPDGPASPAEAYTSLYTWAEANGYQTCGPLRETWLIDASDPGGQISELQLPVARRAAFQVGIDKKETNMEPKIVTRPGFKIAGLLYQGKNENQEISVLWQDFFPRLSELPRVEPHMSYGVCIMSEGLPEGEFEYIAGIRVDDLEEVPEGIVVRDIPGYKYAVFEHRGSLAKLQETYHNVYNVWMPEAGLEPDSNLDMEVYTEEFDGFQENSILYIYIPVK